MQYTVDSANLITLCSFQELSYNQKFKLLDGLKRNSPDFARYGQILIKTLSGGVYNKVRAEYFDGEYRKKLFEELDRRGIFCVTYIDSDYPAELKATPYPPITLFCRGRRENLKKRKFAVVGSRRTGGAVYSLARKVAGELSSDFCIVTGSADGADSAAIEGALPTGNIIVVLAHGHDAIDGMISAPLVKEAQNFGLVISEHPPEVEPRSFLYPVRNRIIAGLSEGGLIVSAAEKSGALITAEYLEEYSKKTFAFPYAPSSPTGVGCNKLIKRGAYLCENSQDILSVFGIEHKKSVELPEGDERDLYEEIKAEGEAFLPAVAEKLGKAPFQLIPLISKLEIKGLIVRLGGNRYSVI